MSGNGVFGNCDVTARDKLGARKEKEESAAELRAAGLRQGGFNVLTAEL